MVRNNNKEITELSIKLLSAIIVKTYLYTNANDE